MTGIVRRINLLTALALLLSGLLQPLAALQGVTCARTHAPTPQAQQTTSAVVDGPTSAPDDSRVTSAPHRHDPGPQTDPAGAPSTPCGGAAVPSERNMPSPAVKAGQLLRAGDLPPASLSIRFLFRPPRLS